jgi:hypothetical protein
VNGLPALSEALTALAVRGDRRAAETIGRLAPFVQGRGACRHPDGATRLIVSALTAFRDDVRRHQLGGPCPGLRRAPVLPVPPTAPPAGSGRSAAPAVSASWAEGAATGGAVAR